MKLLIIAFAVLFATVSGAMLEVWERQLFLDMHNDLRADLARGTVPGLPPAADMKQLVWDNQLAALANERVNQCDYEHDRRDGHSDNLAYSTMRSRGDAIATAVNSWWNEHKDYEYSDTFDGQYGNSLHFTQMAHAKANRLGCALAEGCHTDELPENSTLIRCQYAPWGNVIGDSVYSSGAACTRCAQGEICADGALCAATPNDTSNNVNASGVHPSISASIDGDKRTQTNTDKRVNEAETKNGTRDSSDDFVNVPDPKTRVSNRRTNTVKTTANGASEKNYYCFTRVPSICELASKYGIYKEPSINMA